MKILQCFEIGDDHPSTGRFANKLWQYVFLVDIARKHGAQLRLVPWIGEMLFELESERPEHIAPSTDFAKEGWETQTIVTAPMFFRVPTHYHPEENIQQIRSLFKWRHKYHPSRVPICEVVIHIRGGDFMQLDWCPKVHLETFMRAVGDAGLNKLGVHVVSGDAKPRQSVYPDDLDYLYDFQLMVNAKALFCYPMSMFSYVASLLNENDVFIPRGYTAGETKCRFEKRS